MRRIIILFNASLKRLGCNKYNSIFSLAVLSGWEGLPLSALSITATLADDVPLQRKKCERRSIDERIPITNNKDAAEDE